MNVATLRRFLHQSLVKRRALRAEVATLLQDEHQRLAVFGPINAGQRHPGPGHHSRSRLRAVVGEQILLDEDDAEQDCDHKDGDVGEDFNLSGPIIPGRAATEFTENTEEGS